MNTQFKELLVETMKVHQIMEKYSNEDKVILIDKIEIILDLDLNYQFIQSWNPDSTTASDLMILMIRAFDRDHSVDPYQLFKSFSRWKNKELLDLLHQMPGYTEINFFIDQFLDHYMASSIHV